MKKDTLKNLIELSFEDCDTISDFKHRVLNLIDLYQEDSNIEKINFVKKLVEVLEFLLIVIIVY